MGREGKRRRGGREGRRQRVDLGSLHMECSEGRYPLVGVIPAMDIISVLVGDECTELSRGFWKARYLCFSRFSLIHTYR